MTSDLRERVADVLETEWINGNLTGEAAERLTATMVGLLADPVPAPAADGGEVEGIGAWANHDDPHEEWPSAEDWGLTYLAGVLADAEDMFWTAYHRACEERGEDAGDALGSQYDAMARRILTDPALADLRRTERAEGAREAAERIAAAIEGINRHRQQPVSHYGNTFAYGLDRGIDLAAHIARAEATR